MAASAQNRKLTDSDNVDSRKTTSRSTDFVAEKLSVDTGDNFVVDSALDKRVWRKLDWYLLPLVAMFYLLSFLDRANIGNARVAGLQKDLKLTNTQYSIALTVTYVPYIVAELPSNLMLKAVGPKLLLPTMLTIWGVVCTLQGVVKGYAGLLACRFFLGLIEGGVFPGLVLYLSFFYPRNKMHLRISVFFSLASLSGAFSGILAYGLIRIDRGRPGWAWIFIVEGVFTVAFGLMSFFALPNSPSTAYFLTQQEKDYVLEKLTEDGTVEIDGDGEKFSWGEVGRVFLMPQVGLIALVFFLDGTVLYGLAYFTPSIVQGLGYTAARAQLMSVPPFAVAAVFALAAAWFSDHYRCRGLVMIFCSVLCTIGFAMFLASEKTNIQYASLFLSISGTYASAPTLSAWNANNAAHHVGRATAIAIGFICTNSGGILATWLLGALSPAPRYTSATITLLVFSVAMGVISAVLMWYLGRENKKKEGVRTRMKREEEQKGLGDRSAWFIYNL